MKDTRLSPLVPGVLLAAILMTILMFASMPAAAQSKAADSKAPCIGCSPDGATTPHTPDGHPDLSGYWGGNAGNTGTEQFERTHDGSILYDFSTTFNERPLCLPNDETPRCLAPNQPPYKPEYLAKVKKIASGVYGVTTAEDPQMDCKPLGVPRAGIGGIEIVQGPQSVAILYENAPYSLYRIIYTDGRPHPADLDTSYMGHSIGHWEGGHLGRGRRRPERRNLAGRRLRQHEIREYS